MHSCVIRRFSFMGELFPGDAVGRHRIADKAVATCEIFRTSYVAHQTATLTIPASNYSVSSIARISKFSRPAGMSTATFSPIFLPPKAMAMGLLVRIFIGSTV